MLYQSCKAPDPQNGTQRQVRNKQSAPWGNGAMLCKNLFGDSIREGVSYPLFTQVLLPLRLPRHPQQCPSLLWHWHLIQAFRLFDTIVLRTEVNISEKCFSRAWMLLLIRVHVLGNRSFFDSAGADARWHRCHPPAPLCIASGLRVVLQVCVGEEGFEEELQGFNTWSASINQLLLMSMRISLHISYPGGIFLTSDLIVFWTVLRAETCLGQRAIGFSILPGMQVLFS